MIEYINFGYFVWCKIYTCIAMVLIIIAFVTIFKFWRTEKRKRLESERLLPPFLDAENDLYCEKYSYCVKCLDESGTHYNCDAIKAKLSDKHREDNKDIINHIESLIE